MKLLALIGLLTCLWIAWKAARLWWNFTFNTTQSKWCKNGEEERISKPISPDVIYRFRK